MTFFIPNNKIHTITYFINNGVLIILLAQIMHGKSYCTIIIFGFVNKIQKELHTAKQQFHANTERNMWVTLTGVFFAFDCAAENAKRKMLFIEVGKAKEAQEARGATTAESTN